MTLRAIETLKSCDIILAEDTRHTRILLQHFQINVPMAAYHAFNEHGKTGEVLNHVLAGAKVGLVTDAGTPCISDPGNMVVSACAARGIPVIPVPGCSAGIAAVSISGFDAREFAFYGFLPREKKDLQNKLKEIGRGVRVAVLHESPYRIIALAEAIRDTLPEARLAVCCDLTKLHEKTLYGTPDEILAALTANEKTEKGEYCVVMDLHGVTAETEETVPASGSVAARLADEMDRGLSFREAQEALIRKGEKKNAVKQAALRLKKALTE